jgi:hypothetical protein
MRPAHIIVGLQLKKTTVARTAIKKLEWSMYDSSTELYFLKHSFFSSSSCFTVFPVQVDLHFIPKWLFDFLLSSLFPFDDSRQACAILILAGIPAPVHLFDGQHLVFLDIFFARHLSKSGRNRKGKN